MTVKTDLLLLMLVKTSLMFITENIPEYFLQ